MLEEKTGNWWKYHLILDGVCHKSHKTPVFQEEMKDEFRWAVERKGIQSHGIVGTWAGALEGLLASGDKLRE